MKNLRQYFRIATVLIVLAILAPKNTIAQSVQNTSLRGTIYDAESKQALIGATVFVPGTKFRASTDKNGAFRLATATPPDSVVVSYIGFKSTVVKAPFREALSVALTPAEASLQNVVVSASREAALRTEAPVAISVVSAKMLDETKPKQLFELMNKVPGVTMVNLGNEQHMMAIRQPFTTNSYFLYMEDGIPLRAAGVFNHNALIEMNMLAVSSVEVVKGPASSLYGSEAVGGAVNFITLRPTVVPSLKVGYQGDNFNYHRAQVNGGGMVTENLGISGGGYYASQKNSWMTGSDFSKLSVNLRADYALSGSAKLILSGAWNDYTSQMGGSADSAGFYNRNYQSLADFAYRTVKAGRVRATLEQKWDDKNESFLTLFYRNNSVGQLPSYAFKRVNNNPAIAHGQINSNDFTSYGAVAQHSAKFDFLASKLIAGVSVDYTPNSLWAYYIRLDRNPQTGIYTGYTPRPDSMLTNYNAYLLNSAAYAQYEFVPIAGAEHLKITLGARYDRLDFRFINNLPPSSWTGAPSEQRGFNAFTPKVGATYDIANGSGAYLNFSQGFCPPTISQLYSGVKVPNLQPAYFNNYEIGGWTSLVDEALYLDIALYQMDGFNELVSYLLSDNSTETRNSGQTLHRGVEFGLTYKPSDEWFFRFGGTNALHQFVKYQTSEAVRFDGNRMVGAPDVTINTELTYRPAWLQGFRVSAEWQYMSPFYTDNANKYLYNDATLFGLRGISFMNLRAGYRFEHFDVFLNAMNITNELYATNVTRGNFGATYTPSAPRLFSFGVQYTFAGKE